MNSVESVIESLKRDYNYIIDDDYDNEPIEIEFEKLENSRIVLSDKVKEIFKNISLTTLIDKKEIGFLAYGMEYLDNQVVLEEVIISDALLKSEVTEFGPLITEQLKRRINSVVDDREVVCFGHSHPNISDEYNCFSLSDLVSVRDLTLKNKEFIDKDMQLIACLISDDYKFIYYNPDDDKFYRIEM